MRKLQDRNPLVESKGKRGDLFINLTIMLIFVLLCVAFFGRLTGSVKGILGFHVNVIVSGSMEPKLKVGDVIISRSYHGQTLEVGDIITYEAKSGEMAGSLITHEIIAIEEGIEGLIVTTKGTAALNADTPIEEEAIVSVMLFNAVPLKYCYKIIAHPLGFLLVIVLPLVLTIVNETRTLIEQYKEEKRKE